jgi:hypothetical protein
MANTSSRYTRKLKDFPDVGDYSSMYDPNAEVMGGIAPLISNPTLKDLVKSHVVYNSPLDIGIEAKYSPKDSTRDPMYTAQLLREIMSSSIADKLEKSNLDTGDILPNKNEKVNLSPLSPEKISEGTSGEYFPPTGNILLDFSKPEKDIEATYAHELAHKAEAQAVGREGKNVKYNLPKIVLQNNQRGMGSPAVSTMDSLDPVTTLSAKDLVNNYYRQHHRADAPNAWEIEALKNLETGKPIREPMTRDLSKEYKEAISKSMSKGK